ncbi:hypothetical protein [Prolixibacter denitrificans]|jgi:hypothetical protein|uniref:Uncharacterized protein n=1 Tax=Prolixibacter denitrificans TaxID=1541063 RepID=A0A2P8CFL8_9BACT|nr:hypothetical protein [Prolixibacter denitrificans]PSK83689.1 hypothetical protein CLV93_103104 [Prolixibacter denitrificans]GET23234.1 hypothetical protein JCM18694_34800 [Prolixibacter denitrificans]
MKSILHLGWKRRFGLLLAVVVLSTGALFGQREKQSKLKVKDWYYYPLSYLSKPDIVSPAVFKDGTEAILVMKKDSTYGIVRVTVENGTPLLYSNQIKWMMGKGQQLGVDQGDFPALAKNGLHDEAELEGKDRITGFPVEIIDVIGRPNGFSYAGFMAKDENILSVLKGDNQTVRAMGLTHPQMAKPLFHVWNLVLKEVELGHWRRFYDNISVIFYNGHQLSFKGERSKGWQVSIFQDEIQGSFDFTVSRPLTPEEKTFLDEHYSQLSTAQRKELEAKLTSLHFSEMAPYYIMRYGFYEGHTAYRTDPVAIAFIFGLKTLPELDTAFNHNLFDVLTKHFTK